MSDTELPADSPREIPPRSTPEERKALTAAFLQEHFRICREKMSCLQMETPQQIKTFETHCKANEWDAKDMLEKVRTAELLASIVALKMTSGAKSVKEQTEAAGVLADIYEYIALANTRPEAMALANDYMNGIRKSFRFTINPDSGAHGVGR